MKLEVSSTSLTQDVKLFVYSTLLVVLWVDYGTAEEEKEREDLSAFTTVFFVVLFLRQLRRYFVIPTTRSSLVFCMCYDSLLSPNVLYTTMLFVCSSLSGLTSVWMMPLVLVLDIVRLIPM